MRRRSIIRQIISSLFGIILFLVILGIANIIIPNVNNAAYSEIVGFFNSSLGFLIILFLVGLVNEIFWNFYLPFDLIAPIISTVFAIFIMIFFEKFWNFIKDYFNINFSIPFDILYIIIPLIVLVSGYLLIISEEYWFRRKRRLREEYEDRITDRINQATNKTTDRIEEEIDNLKKHVEKIDWEDVGDEFKVALYNLGKSINNALDEKDRSKQDKQSNKTKTSKKKKR